MVRLISWIEAENIMMGFDFPSLLVFVKLLIHISAGSVKRKGLAIEQVFRPLCAETSDIPGLFRNWHFY